MLILSPIVDVIGRLTLTTHCSYRRRRLHHPGTGKKSLYVDFGNFTHFKASCEEHSFSLRNIALLPSTVHPSTTSNQGLLCWTHTLWAPCSPLGGNLQPSMEYLVGTAQQHKVCRQEGEEEEVQLPPNKGSLAAPRGLL